MKKRLDIQNSTVITQRGRLAAPAREIPPAVERLMKSDAYWDKKHIDHRAVVEAINNFFANNTPAPETGSVISATVNGVTVSQAAYRPQQDPRFSSETGTTPEQISNLHKGA